MLQRLAKSALLRLLFRTGPAATACALRPAHFDGDLWTNLPDRTRLLLRAPSGSDVGCFSATQKSDVHVQGAEQMCAASMLHLRLGT